MARVRGVSRSDFAPIANSLSDFISDDLLEDNMEEIERYFPDTTELRDKFDWNLRKLKIMLLLRYPRGGDELDKILSFLEPPIDGWQEHSKEGYVYRMSNHCLARLTTGNHTHCKRRSVIKTSEVASEALQAVQSIFLGNNEQSKATLFIFSYCLASLFGSMLSRNRFNFPFVLQVACDRKSKTYELLKEIVGICDANMGLLDDCRSHQSYLKSDCYAKPSVLYAPRSISSGINDLMSSKDIPIIIDGDGGIRNFNALLKEVANIPVKRDRLGLGDRFKLLPIFVSPSIDHSYDNVFSMDLTNLNIGNDYLELIKEHRNLLASWVLDLVLEPKRHLFQFDKYNAAKLDTYHFLRGIRENKDQIHTKFTTATSDEVERIGCLSFFFKSFLMVANNLIVLEADDGIEGRRGGKEIKVSSHELISQFMDRSETSLFNTLHEHAQSHMLPGRIDVGDGVTEDKAVASAIRWGVTIQDHYKAHKVYFDIKRFDVRGEKFTFHIRPAKGSSYKKISEHVDGVRQSMDIKVLEVQVADGSMAIVLSEKSLDENSLVAMLDSKEFKESKAILPYAIGYEPSGDMVISDVFNYPHMLIGGTTKSGKSTALYSLLLSILSKRGADEVNILIFDYGRTELKLFNEIPHLSRSIIGGGDYEAGYSTILTLESEMYRRRQLFKEDRKTFDRLPYVICIIDEFRLFINGLPRKEDSQILQESIMNLLTLARGFKIHLILATQNPTIRNIKIDPANIDAKLALRCSNQHQSKAVLGYGGAEHLPGKGAMIFHSEEHTVDKRLQGSFINDRGEDEGKESELAIKIRSMDFNYDYDDTYKFVIDESEASESIIEADKSVPTSPNQKGYDEALAKAIMMSLSCEEIAISHIMDKCGAAYPRASKLIKELYELGLVGEKHKNKSRRTIPKTADEITSSGEIMKALTVLGHTVKDIEEAISKRSHNDA